MPLTSKKKELVTKVATQATLFFAKKATKEPDSWIPAMYFHNDCLNEVVVSGGHNTPYKATCEKCGWEKVGNKWNFKDHLHFQTSISITADSLKPVEKKVEVDNGANRYDLFKELKNRALLDYYIYKEIVPEKQKDSWKLIDVKYKFEEKRALDAANISW